MYTQRATTALLNWDMPFLSRLSSTGRSSSPPSQVDDADCAVSPRGDSDVESGVIFAGLVRSGSCGRARAQSLVSGPSADWSSMPARWHSCGLSRTHGANPLDPSFSNGYRKACCRSPQPRGSSRTQGARPTTDGSSWCTRARAATAACFGLSARPPRSATSGSVPSVARSRRKRRAPAQRP